MSSSCAVQPDHVGPTLHPDDRRKADKLKKRRKENQAGEPSAAQQAAHAATSEPQHAPSLGGRPIKEEPEDDLTIPLPPPSSLGTPSPSPCKQEPNEERQCWEGPELEDSMVKVEKMDGLPGNRTVFRQGKQVVFRDEDGSGEDEDIMVDSGKASNCCFTTFTPILRSSTNSPVTRLVCGVGHCVRKS